jgi:hypothetical protein
LWKINKKNQIVTKITDICHNFDVVRGQYRQMSGARMAL